MRGGVVEVTYDVAVIPRNSGATCDGEEGRDGEEEGGELHVRECWVVYLGLRSRLS